MAEDLQYWVHDGNIWGETNTSMLQPCLAAATALPVICDINHWRVDEQMNDPTSCFNMPGFDLLPSAHGNWTDQDFTQWSGKEANPKRYKLNQETTSAWSPNYFSGRISPTKQSTVDGKICGDRRPWNSTDIEPTLGESTAFLSSLQSLDDHSNFIDAREQIGVLSSFIEERSRRKAYHGDSLCVNDDETLLRRVRMETSSPLPTFKVRKEKLGDRVTALQQLVSPFGKTDTASVLNDAVQYIEFLHNQIRLQVLCDQSKDRPRRDLRSRGLCLVQISGSTTGGQHNTSN